MTSEYAFDSTTRAYCPFPTRSDAMLAGLLLSNKVSYSIMNIFLEIITHPDFDSRNVTYKSALDILRIAEEARVEGRLSSEQSGRRAVVGVNNDDDNDSDVQAGFPQVILYEVLDILARERHDIIFSGSGAPKKISSVVIY